MKDTEILEKAIVRAEEKGFDLVKWYHELFKIPVSESRSDIFEWFFSHMHTFTDLLLFSHTFAKAVWGTEDFYLVDKTPDWAHDEGDIEEEWISQEEFDIYKEEYHRQLNLPQLKIHLEREDYQIYLKKSTRWEVHLQLMVLQENRIQYLEPFVQ